MASYGAEQQEEDEILASGARKSILANGEAYAGAVDEEPFTMSEEQAYKSVTAGNLLE